MGVEAGLEQRGDYWTDRRIMEREMDYMDKRSKASEENREKDKNDG